MARKVQTNKKPQFVIHEHKGDQTGFYLRITHKKNLLNWAIPRGIPRQAGRRFPAIRLSDGEPRQAEYEGRITRGQYGPGILSIWDRGTCQVDKDKEARIEFRLKGAKTKGKYSLVRFRQQDDQSWMITRLLEEKAPQPKPKRLARKAQARKNSPRPARTQTRPPRRRQTKTTSLPSTPSEPKVSRSPASGSSGGKLRHCLGILIAPVTNIYYDVVNERERRRALTRRNRTDSQGDSS